ncbi:MAG: DUF393 domain-containing protein [Chloroflexota bacterium]
MSERLLVLFDRDCGICAALAGHLRRWDSGGRLELLALQSAADDPRPFVRSVAARHPLHDELHVVDVSNGAVRSGGAAALEIAARLPGGQIPAILGRLPPAAWAIGLGYAIVARNRRAISRALRLDSACVVPER